MATAFYNVADPNNTFAVHSTTMIKQELGFWLSVFTPDSVDDDIDEFISSIVATTHYTRTDVSQACDVALMLHAMPHLKDYALNTGVLCLRRLHLIYRHTLAVEPELIEPHLINLVTPISPHQQLPTPRTLAAQVRKLVLSLDPPAAHKTIDAAEEELRFRAHPNGLTTVFGALRSDKAVVISQVLEAISADQHCDLNEALYKLAAEHVDSCSIVLNLWDHDYLQGAGWLSDDCVIRDMQAASTKTSSSYITPIDIRAFVIGRDGTCRFPGCDRPAWECDMDHVISDADGGPTTAANLQALCRHCHNIKTDKLAIPTMHKDGTVEWRFKDGTVAITHPTGPLAGVEMPNPPPPPAEPQRTTPKFRQTFSQRHTKRIRRQAS